MTKHDGPWITWTAPDRNGVLNTVEITDWDLNALIATYIMGWTGVERISGIDFWGDDRGTLTLVPRYTHDQDKFVRVFFKIRGIPFGIKAFAESVTEICGHEWPEAFFFMEPRDFCIAALRGVGQDVRWHSGWEEDDLIEQEAKRHRISGPAGAGLLSQGESKEKGDRDLS